MIHLLEFLALYLCTKAVSCFDLIFEINYLNKIYAEIQSTKHRYEINKSLKICMCKLFAFPLHFFLTCHLWLSDCGNNLMNIIYHSL